MSWKDKIKSAIDSAAQTSKELASSAGAAAQEFGGKAAEKASVLGSKAASAAKDTAKDIGAKAVELGGIAADKARDAGEWGVLNIEIKKLENDALVLVEKLGLAVFEELVEKETPSLDANNTAIKETLAELKKIRDTIVEKEARLELLKLR